MLNWNRVQKKGFLRKKLKLTSLQNGKVLSGLDMACTIGEKSYLP